MTPPRLTNGSWFVIGLVSIAIVLAAVALKVRRFPHQWQQDPSAGTQPTTASK